MTLQALAKEALAWFEQMQLEQRTVWVWKDGTPEWIRTMVQEAHAEFFPDDWRYAFIVAALAHISDSDTPEEIELEADVYTHDLLSWFSSNITRLTYVDEAVMIYGHSDRGIKGDIANGQLLEKQAVYLSVLDSLKHRLEGIEDQGAVSFSYTVMAKEVNHYGAE